MWSGKDPFPETFRKENDCAYSTGKKTPGGAGILWGTRAHYRPEGPRPTTRAGMCPAVTGSVPPVGSLQVQAHTRTRVERRVCGHPTSESGETGIPECSLPMNSYMGLRRSTARYLTNSRV